MKKLLAVALLLILLFMLSACGDITFSGYSAIGLMKTETSHSCKISFYSLTGTMNFKLTRTDAGEGAINYSIEVEQGEVTLYYNSLGTKQQLAHVTAGQTITTSGGYVERGQTVTITIEAAKGTRGKVFVDLNN
ncbi:MAG: hypothetical protein J6Q55_03235 [Clostridia bacterium]|nr:hypothetical protein [Clostridia bacterium]